MTSKTEKPGLNSQQLGAGLLIGLLHFLGLTFAIFYGLLYAFGASEAFADVLASVLASLGILALYIFFYKDALMWEVKEWRNPLNYALIIGFYFISMFTLLFYSAIITIVFPNVELSNDNEDSLSTMKEFLPLYLLFVVILAPLVEEIIFRLFLYKWLTRYNRNLALIVVTSLFAFIHLLSSFRVTNSLEFVFDEVIYLQLGSSILYVRLGALLTLPIYLISSFYMTLAMRKYDKLIIPLGMHFINNFVAAILN